MLQDDRPVSYASPSLTPTQINFAQIEKELLTIVFACEHFHFYIHGSRVTIRTDHRPVIGSVKKSFSLISPRLQKMLLRYDFQLILVPGKYMYIPDALSRSPIDEKIPTPELEAGAVEITCGLFSF